MRMVGGSAAVRCLPAPHRVHCEPRKCGLESGTGSGGGCAQRQRPVNLPEEPAPQEHRVQGVGGGRHHDLAPRQLPERTCASADGRAGPAERSAEQRFERCGRPLPHSPWRLHRDRASMKAEKRAWLSPAAPIMASYAAVEPGATPSQGAAARRRMLSLKTPHHVGEGSLFFPTGWHAA